MSPTQYWECVSMVRQWTREGKEGSVRESQQLRGYGQYPPLEEGGAGRESESYQKGKRRAEYWYEPLQTIKGSCMCVPVTWLSFTALVHTANHDT